MKISYKILNLDCPNCALEVQNHLCNQAEIESADCNFAMKTLTISSRQPIELKKIRELVGEVEKDAIVEELHKEQNHIKFNWFLLGKIILAIVFLILGICFKNFYVKLAFFVISYLFCGYDIIFKATKNLFKNKSFFNENMLMSIATLGAFAIGEYLEACLVMILFQIGELLEHISVEKTTNEILNSINSLEKFCSVLRENNIVKLAYKDIKIGDILILKAGEMCPVEAEILEGEGDFDLSSLTGEFASVNLSVGQKITSSSIVVSGLIKAKALEGYENSNSVKILELIAQGKKDKSKSDKFITKFSKVYTPIVFILAVLIAFVPPLFNGEWMNYIYRALSFLVLSCPCAVIISIPLTFFCGHGLCAKNGILVKGNEFLENLNDAKIFVCDKTGTITYGKFFVDKIVTFIDEKEFISILCHGEALSNHPIARSILSNFDIEIDTNKIMDYKEIAGNGISCKIDGNNILIGGIRFLENNNIKFDYEIKDGTIVCVAINDKFVGYVSLKDKIKSSAKMFIDYLKENKIKTIMMTGDGKTSAETISNALRFDECYFELLPEQKVELLKEKSLHNKTAFVGDGLNDAGAIAVCDVGIAMAKNGNDITTENADIVIIGVEPENIVVAHKVAKKTCKKIKINLIVALVTKLLFLMLSAFGLSFMWLAVLADVGLTILLVLNSMLLLKSKVR